MNKTRARRAHTPPACFIDLCIAVDSSTQRHFLKISHGHCYSLSTRFFKTCLDQKAVLCTELNKGSTSARASKCTAYTARVKVINPKNATGSVIQSWCIDKTYKYMYTSLDNLKSQLGKAIVAWLSKKNERTHATDCHLYSAN